MAAVPLLDLAPPSVAQSRQSASSPAPVGKKKGHRLILQVNTNDPAVMNLALNNAANTEQYYRGIGEPVQIEIVTFGPGLNMLREDTSPVKARIKSLAETSRSISFAACDNTRANMSRVEQKEIPLVSQATVVSSGVVRVMELQEQGWSYVRP
jgi:intracellular sulfur oxidation DsrE/DsrF family protein